MESSSSTKSKPEVAATSELYRSLCEVVSEARRASVPPASSSLCYVIVSTSSSAWTTLTLIASALIGAALMTPYWLVGAPDPRRLPDFPSAVNRSIPVDTVSIGVFNACAGRRGPSVVDVLGALTGGASGEECATFVSGFDMPDDEFPDAWKSALILLTAAAVLMAFTDFSALASVCIQSIFGKSIFTVSGLLQSIAALLLVIGQLLYTFGWSSRRVRDVCGDDAGPFVLDHCHIGVSFYGCMAGTALVFVCGLLSMRAETSTSTDQVEKLILDGKLIVCVP